MIYQYNNLSLLEKDHKIKQIMALKLEIKITLYTMYRVFQSF